jgi:hypothetical protein
LYSLFPMVTMVSALPMLCIDQRASSRLTAHYTV